MHKQRQDARRDALQARVARAEKRQPPSGDGPAPASTPTEARLNSIFRAAPIGIGLVVDRRIVEMNEQFCDMVGYSQDELAGQSVRLLYFNDEEYDYIGTEKYRQIREHGTGTIETCWRHKNGAAVNVLLTSTPLNPDDLSEGVTFTALDITARKRVEEELQSIFDLSLDMVCIADINTTAFVKVNPAFERTLGYTPDDLLGRSFLDLLHPDDVEKTQAVTEERLRQGETVVNFENRYRCKDGSYRWLNWTSHPKPERGLTYAIARDITERRHAEEALRLGVEKYRRMQANIPGLVYEYALHPDGTSSFPYASPESSALFGLKPDEIMRDGSLLIDLIYPDDVQRYENSLAESARSLSPWRQEMRAIVDGQVRWYDCMSRPERLEDGTIRWDGIILEITDRKRAEKALKDSEQRYRAIVEDQTEFICRFRPDGCVTFVNEAVCRFYGRSRDDLIGTDFSTWMPPAEYAALWRALQ